MRKILIIFSFGLFPFLWIIEQGSGVNWFLSVGVPISCSVVFLIWINYTLVQLSIDKMKIVALMIAAIPLVDFIVSISINHSFLEHYNQPMKALTLVLSLAFSIGMYVSSCILKK